MMPSDKKPKSEIRNPTILQNFPPATGGGAWLLPVVVFGFLWFTLINQLRVEWTLNPQYSFGWAVPFLCAYLIWQKVTDHRLPTTDYRSPPAVVRISAFQDFSFQLLPALLAFLYAPVRLVQAANPEWSFVSWGLALIVIGLTLWLLHSRPVWLPRGLTARNLAFPIGFFLVAVPWPSVIEGPLIQALTRADVRATVELVGWFGIPALPHGNVIEVATGEVGISDACSGIRSFQATLMISLFLGELYSLRAGRRVLCVLGGFAMSFLFNLVRMSLLVWVAARHGINAIANWHDPAGVTILLACFGGLWLFAVSLRRPVVQLAPPRPAEAGPKSAPHTASAWPLFVLGAWIVLTEIGVESWYRAHEAHLPPAKQWTISWPTNNPTFKELPLAADALQLLKCDENRRAGWQEDDRQWQVIFIKWNPGTRVQLGHSPNFCMTGAGHTLTTISSCEWFAAGGLRLPFAVFEVTDAPQPFYIFYCLWNDRLNAPGSGVTFLSLCGNKLAPVLAGIRNPGYRSLELSVGGVNSAGEAESAVRAELGKILVVNTVASPLARPGTFLNQPTVCLVRNPDPGWINQ
jgi:exosortase